MDRQKLFTLLDKHAARLPRITLRYAIKQLEPAQREDYLGLKKAG